MHQIAYQHSKVFGDRAIFLRRSVIDYYISRGATVSWICLRHLTKLITNQLFQKLMHRNMPGVLVKLFHSWYSCSCSVVVRWDLNFSHAFELLQCGVRQRGVTGVLSSVLFAVYIESIVDKLEDCGLGCWFGDVFVGCMLEADDIIMPSYSLTDYAFTAENGRCLCLFHLRH